MKPTTSFNSGAFRFAVAIAALFAAGSIILLFVVERTIRGYAEEATSIGLRSEMATLTREMPEMGVSGLIETIVHRQSPGSEQPFRYLLVDAKRHRLAGDLPLSAARVGRGQVAFVDDPPVNGVSAAAEPYETLGAMLPHGLILAVGTDTFDVQTLRRRVDAFTIWSGLCITTIALIGGYMIGGLFLRRLERVNEAASRIMAGSLTERLPAIGMSPEFDHLSQNLNLMLDRIGDLMEGLRQVSTDIAHDLRTPLTRLRQQLEGLREAESSEEYQRGVDRALDQTDAILSIFRALLKIGAIEGGDGRQLLVPINLSEIVGRIVQFYHPLAEDQRKTLRSDIVADVQILGDPELIAQALSNLLDNALKYTPPGAVIAANVLRIGGHPVAIIVDDGPGVPEGEREKILRRFYRVDASRSAPGAGLGLSLVAAIVRMHQGAVVIEDAGPGLRARMSFPGLA